MRKVFLFARNSTVGNIYKMAAKNLRVTKCNKLLGASLIESATRLGLKEHKIALSVISLVSPNDQDFKKYRLSLAELLDMSELDKKNSFKTISQSCERLMSSIITIHETDDPKDFLKVPWFTHARYNDKSNTLEFSITPELKPYLLRLKTQFTTYYLSQVTKLSAVYSIRMYELLREYLPIKEVERGTTIVFREMDYQMLRAKLGAMPDSYKNFYDFRRYVLEKSQVELKEKTDLAFDFKIKLVGGRGRSVGKIIFRILHNEVNADLEAATRSEKDSQDVDETVSMMRKFIIEYAPELSDASTLLLIRSFSEKELSEGLIKYFAKRDSDEIKGDNASFLFSILRNVVTENEKQALAAKANMPKTTLEKLTDDSWDRGENGAVDIVFDDED